MLKPLLIVSSVFGAIIAIAVYQFTNVYLSSTPCDQDPPIIFDKNHQYNACQVFSTEYKDARKKFRIMSRLHGASEIISLPIVENENGNDNDNYTTDIAIFPGNRPGTILHTSGTHGVEGYAGSAIQLALLESMGGAPSSPFGESSKSKMEEATAKDGDDNDDDMLDDRPTLILVHAVNPYGMAKYRRFNEHNVDLNRNCIPDMTTFLKQRDPNIAGYNDFKEFISPPHEPSDSDYTFGFWTTAIPLLIQHGFAKLKRVMVAGQYHHPEGVFYGGNKWEPSVERLIQFLESRQLLDDLLVHIDVHTGLGKIGKDTLMFEDIESDRKFNEQTLREMFPTAESIITPFVQDKKAMEGYDLTKGMLPSLIANKTKNKCLTVTQEFGTLPGVLVGRALTLENSLYHHGAKTTENEKRGRELIQQAFYPQSTEWRRSIVQRGVALVLEAIRHSNSIAPKTSK